jgi:adenosylmethionine-8-amino-7-oxononanoate aminotransferase
MFTGNNEMITLKNGYHGAGATSQHLTSLRTWKYNVPK